MQKKATIYSNDALQPRVDLTVRGQVDKFAQITPAHVIIRGHAGERLRRKVTVKPSSENPFSITKVKAKHGNNIKIAWKQEETPEGKTWVIEVENTRTSKGRYNDTLFLFTDSSLKPKIPVQVRGSIAAQPNKPIKTQ